MRTHGLFGDILCKPLSNDIERHSLLKRVYLETTQGIKEVIISDSEIYGNVWKFHFDGFSSPEAIKPFVNAYVLIPENERLPLPKGEFYFSDFEDFKAINAEGNILGSVISAEEMPSVNIFNLLVEGKEVAIPWIDDCILNIDTKGKTITINIDYIKPLLL